MTKRIDCDVIVVGLGPSGMMATAFLLQQGLRVVAVEKHSALYGLPRAGHVDHEIVRFLQELQEVEPFLEDAFPIGSYRWFNGAGQTLLEMNWGGQSISGFNSDYMMYQPVLEDCLQAAIGRHADRLTLLRGREAISIEQDATHVTCRTVGLQFGDGAPDAGPDDEIVVTGSYLLAADGARSAVREHLGIPREDLGFNEIWLDVDVRVLQPLPAMDPHQICDPRRPIFISPLGKRHHRFEWAVLPTEDADNFSRPETAWALLAEQNVGPEDVEIVRQQVYTFEARVAERWRQDRVFLIGDAAHTMPPFMGQGACSGMRDAVNLAWKLEMVLSGNAADDILDSYQTEREPHTRTWIELSMKTGEVSCTLDADTAEKRDALLLSGTAPPMPDFPDLVGGILDSGSGKLAGTTFPQREVTAHGLSGWIDDVAGTGFRVISWDVFPAPVLSRAQRAFLLSIGARHVVLSEAADGGCTRDDSGFYRDWMKDKGIQALLVRPDHYIFGTARNARDLGRLVDSLREQLSQGQQEPAVAEARG